MLHLFSALFASTVLAAESLLIPFNQTIVSPVPQPEISFAALNPGWYTPAVLGETTDTDTPSDSDQATPSSAQSMYFTMEVTLTPTPPPNPPTGGPTPVPKPKLRKNSYVIALLGDSMIDTMGPGIPNLQKLLTQTYPGISFQLLNYGVGATSILYGKQRLANSYEYLGTQLPSLLSTRPDIVLIESFGYNPLPPELGDINTQWLTLSQIVDEIRSALPLTKIIIGATIAPNASVFGDGAPGLSFDTVGKKEHTDRIKIYIENAIHFAQSQHLPLADAYHASQNGDGDGNIKYINSGDHIHYSDAGRALFAQKIFTAIEGNRLLY